MRSSLRPALPPATVGVERRRRTAEIVAAVAPVVTLPRRPAHEPEPEDDADEEHLDDGEEEEREPEHE